MTVVDIAPRDRVPAPPPGLEDRIVEATLRCIGHWGVAKTTLDDVARGAGCSRASVYRTFPGGKDAVVAAAVGTEIDRFFARLSARMASATDLEDLIVAGVTGASRALASHRALQFVLAHEPETILPLIAFNNMSVVLARVADFAAPHLARWLDSDESRRAAEWVARVVLSYSSCPAGHVDMGDEASVRRLVRAFVLPGLSRQHASSV